ncbi:CinA family protein [Leucobacter albus]|uniref:CinA family protein n=1 Tax=Leucobacter albus TaxID=272210 RepID=A0ABW3THX3_9MICO
MPESGRAAPAPADLLAAEIVERAARLGLRIAVAESLTGGMLASRIVSVPGASRVLTGAIVAYDTALKASLLGVDPERLAANGPVDAEVARQMAAGVRVACAAPAAGEPVSGAPLPADIGVATTGVAGPLPDAQTGQPAGTVWIGVSSPLGDRSERLAGAEGDRAAIREASVGGALELLAAEIALLEGR